MKKILFKTQQFPHLSETFVLNQITMAIDDGYDVRLLVQDLLDFEESTHSEILEKYAIHEKIILDNYGIPKNKIRRVAKAFVLLFKNILNFSKIAKFIRIKRRFSLTWIYEYAFYQQFRNFEVIHVQYGTNVHPVDIMKRIRGLEGRLIVSFHGHDAFFPINGFIPKNGYYDHLFQKDNIVVANTPYLAGKIAELGCKKENLMTIPVPVNTKYFYPDKPLKNHAGLKLITVGRLDPIKGHRLAVDFMKKLKDKKLQIELTIVGEGQEYNNLENQIADLGLGEEVKMVGRKNQNEIKNLLQESDIYLFTGVPVKGGRRETQGLATLEAEACELPVLAFDSGGVKYTIKNQETGFLCQEYDLDCLEEKLWIMADPEVRRVMGKKARDFVVEHFSVDIIRKRWREIYESSI